MSDENVAARGPLAGLAGFILLSLCLSPMTSRSQPGFPPRLYHQPAYESPVRGLPDDLLVLAGDGMSGRDTVVYRALSQANEQTPHPAFVPDRSTADLGVADIVSSASAPLQLTIRLPETIVAERVYQIWVKSAENGWSNAVTINDPRPLWISPTLVYSSAQRASLPRYIKVIGRNLQPRGVRSVRVRLSGPQEYLLSEPLGTTPGASVRRYAPSMRLPATIARGRYHVAVSVDSVGWTEVPGALLEVMADPPRSKEFDVADPAFGGCRPDDGADDTRCIEKAIEAAAAADHGVVKVGPGTWDLSAGEIILPRGVRLRGQDARLTRIVRHDREDGGNAYPPLITLASDNEVRGIRFATDHEFRSSDHGRPILQLGRTYNGEASGAPPPPTVSDVAIVDNIFDKSYLAIADGGAPIERLIVASNQFGDYHLALELGGNRRNVHHRFGIADSIISHNVFMPGSYVDAGIDQGVYATELGAASRVDFSDNEANGAERRFLNSPDDSPGWRAAFFFHMNDSQEMLLISNNTASCTGDKAGDGEAVALDNNANTFALPAAGSVLAATADTVRIQGPLRSMQNDRSVDADDYYVGHWVRVAQGPGIGQARRIVSYRTDPRGEVTLVVSPEWDVPPQPAASAITIAREFWQAYVIGNTIDQRKPPCTKGNITRPKGGAISVWAESSDSVVEGNRQFDTDGILFQQAYGAEERDCKDCVTNASLVSFLEIRDNLIQGEYDWQSACSLSGIMGSYGAAPTRRSTPPLLSVGVSISHNSIDHADGYRGGAITVQPTWHRGPPGYTRPLIENLLIHHNRIRDVAGPETHAACNYSPAERIGIRVDGEQNVAATVLYMNTCDNVTHGLVDRGIHSRLICDKAPANSCECRGALTE